MWKLINIIQKLKSRRESHKGNRKHFEMNKECITSQSQQAVGPNGQHLEGRGSGSQLEASQDHITKTTRISHSYYKVRWGIIFLQFRPWPTWHRDSQRAVV